MRQVIKEAINQKVLEMVKKKYLDKETILPMKANDMSSVKIAIVVTDISESGFGDIIDLHYRLTGISSAEAELNSLIMREAIQGHFKSYFNLDVDAIWIMPRSWQTEIRLLS